MPMSTILTLVFVVILAAWTAGLIVASQQISPMIRAAERYRTAAIESDRANAKLREALQRKEDLLDKAWAQVEKTKQSQTEWETKIRAIYTAAEEERRALYDDHRAEGQRLIDEWMRGNGPNGQTAKDLALLIARNVDGIGALVAMERLVVSLQEMWPHYDWKLLVWPQGQS